MKRNAPYSGEALTSRYFVSDNFWCFEPFPVNRRKFIAASRETRQTVGIYKLQQPPSPSWRTNTHDRSNITIGNRA
jgi:hypothetical protein